MSIVRHKLSGMYNSMNIFADTKVFQLAKSNFGTPKRKYSALSVFFWDSQIVDVVATYICKALLMTCL